MMIIAVTISAPPESLPMQMAGHTNYFLVFLLCGMGVGIGLAAALLTYRHSSPPPAAASDALRQDALERFKTWNDFWKYFLVSFALVLITSLLGNILKERELDLQHSKQESEALLEKEKQATASLTTENTSLGNFLSNALDERWEKQYAFASYFGHVTSDPDTRKRWEEYANFIKTAHQEKSKLDAEQTRTSAELAKLAPHDPQRVPLEAKLDDVKSKLELNNAILQTPISLSIRGVNLVDGGTLFETGMMIDVGGAPHAYHPDDKSGLDFLANAGSPGHWYGIVTNNDGPDGNPVIQKDTDPAPGFYVSFTSLHDTTKATNNPLRYVNSETIPYIVVPSKLTSMAGVKLGDFAAVLNTRNQKLQYAIVADYGSPSQIGEGSIALAKALGVNANAKDGGIDNGIVYKIFPGSAKGWPITLEEINANGERLLQAAGGQQRLLSELAGRAKIALPAP